jgi:hypothetical protein
VLVSTTKVQAKRRQIKARIERKYLLFFNYSDPAFQHLSKSVNRQSCLYFKDDINHFSG